MRVHATKKLAEKLQKVGFELSESPEANPSALGDWHANITTIQRRQCIVFVHDETRFAIALTGVTQKELKRPQGLPLASQRDETAPEATTSRSAGQALSSLLGADRAIYRH